MKQAWQAFCGVLVLGALALGSGCGRIGATAQERINLALPPPAEVEASRGALDRLATELGQDGKALAANYQARLGERALECAGDFRPSMWTGDDAIREAIGSTPCLDEADRKLHDWVGHRRIALLLAAPPLRPVLAVARPVLEAAGPIDAVAFAERAGVMLVQTDTHYQLIDIGSGESIATGPHGGTAAQLSPNGRLFVSGGSEAEVREAATGDLLARFHGVPADRFFWVHGVGAYYMGGQQDAPTFIDFSTGQSTALAVSMESLEHVSPLVGEPVRHVLGGGSKLAVVALLQSGSTWQPTLAAEINLTGGSWAAATTGSTADGSAVHLVGPDLKLLDTRSTRVSSRSFEPLRLQQVVATGNPDELILCGFYRDAEDAGTECLLHSIVGRTAARLSSREVVGATLAYAGPLQRNAMIDGNTVRVLDRVETDPPEPVGEYLARRALEFETVASALEEQRHVLGGRTDRAALRAAVLEDIRERNGGVMPPLPAVPGKR